MWRIAAICGVAGAVTVAVAVQPAWAIPVGAGVTVAALLKDLGSRRDRNDDG